MILESNLTYYDWLLILIFFYLNSWWIINELKEIAHVYSDGALVRKVTK